MALKRIYRVKWNKLATWLMPVLLRKNKLLAIAKALVSPVNDLYNRFIDYGKDTDYRIGITLSAIHLQRALNDKYDYTLRRIRIVEMQQKEGISLFQREENKPQVLYTKIGEGITLVLYSKEETAGFAVDFIVQVPKALLFDAKEMRAYIDIFKMESKTYIIELK